MFEDDEIYNDGLPPTVCLDDMWCKELTFKPFIIDNLLRKQEKMILSGASKAGKSFALIELAVAIASGTKWLGYYQTIPSSVLYVNFEIDRASFIHRVANVAKALNLDTDTWNEWGGSLRMWNLRGKAVPVDKLISTLIRRVKRSNIETIILDPFYKMQTGNENSARSIGEFCNNLDKICVECDVAIVYCHHHPKGDQSWKKPIDRASGSGAFSRDADVIMDIIELELPQDIKEEETEAFRVTTITRNLAPTPPIDVWFNFPTHSLAHFSKNRIVAPHHELPPHQRAMNARKTKDQKARERNARLNAVYDIIKANGEIPTIKTVSQYMNVSERTVRNSVNEHSNFINENGTIKKVSA